MLLSGAEGLTDVEIVEEHGLSRANARKRLQRGREVVRERLAG